MIPRLLPLMIGLIPLVSASAADYPPAACNPAELPVICNLKIERNNALDELAISEGKRIEEERQTTARAAALGRYWQHYVAGLKPPEKRTAKSRRGVELPAWAPKN